MLPCKWAYGLIVKFIWMRYITEAAILFELNQVRIDSCPEIMWVSL